MEAKHTPAPWNVRNDGREYPNPIIDSVNVGTGYYASLATVTQRDPHPIIGGGISAETAAANALLIAAAPELLAALEQIANETIKNIGSARIIASAAIAKAKGE